MWNVAADILDPPPDPELERYEWVTCERDECDDEPHEGMERKHARPSQIAPDGGWLIWPAEASERPGWRRSG